MPSITPAQEAIAYLQQLLQTEKQEDIQQYNQYIIKQSVAERQRKGTAWFPSELKDSGYGIGDTPFVVIERTRDTDKPHQFSAGKSVSFFTQAAGVENPTAKGVINYVTDKRMKIFLNTPELPEWIDEGKLGVDLLFDERSYREMEKALQLVAAAERNRLAELREMLLGKQNIVFSEAATLPPLPPHLNDSQQAALQQVLEAEDVALIHGPPGTGKTTTLVQIIKALADSGQRVLACAPSNSAVDLLLTRLLQEGLNAVRIGNISRLDEEIVAHTLEGILYALPDAKEIKRMKLQADDYRRRAGKFKRNFGVAEREERRRLYTEARDLTNQVALIEHYLINRILDNASVVCATLVGAADRYLLGKRFDWVVIDEASQALEPATWIPIAKAHKVLFAGDPFQLPPTVKSFDAERKGLSKTLMEKALLRLPKVSLLDVQYRMNEQIMAFPNRYFYNNRLQAHEVVKTWQLPLLNGKNQPVEFIDTAGCGFEEKENPQNSSLYNPEEAALLWKHLEQLLQHINPDLPFPSIGIVSPYKAQVVYLQNMLNDYLQQQQLATHININTIDSFQGQERDIIYISLVRSNEKQDIGFLKDYRRMNVAMTRARKKLVIIGDSATLAQHDFYEQLLDYVQQNNSYTSAWEYMGG